MTMNAVTGRQVETRPMPLAKVLGVATLFVQADSPRIVFQERRNFAHLRRP